MVMGSAASAAGGRPAARAKQTARETPTARAPPAAGKPPRGRPTTPAATPSSPRSEAVLLEDTLAQEGIIVRLGGFFPPAPQGGGAPILQAERAPGCRLDPVMCFRSWDDTPAGRFRPEQLAGLQDRAMVITGEPWRPADGKVQPGYAPAAIAAGRHDRYVRDWAQAGRDTGRGIHLRPT